MKRIRLAVIFGFAVIACCCMMAAGAADDATGRQVLVMLQMPPPHFRPDADYAGGYGKDSGRNARRRIAEQLARAHGLKVVGNWPMPVLGIDCFAMEAQANASAARIAEMLARDPRVQWAQPMNTYHALARNDPLFSLQPGARLWHLADLHRIATGRSVRVAVIDSGVDEDHPDLAGQVAFRENLVDDKPYVPEAHGTAVAGIIAARAGNGLGIEGIAPDSRLLALRACWQEPDRLTRCNSFTLGKALNSAIMHDAQVINLSLSGPRDRLLQRLLDAALERGIRVIGAVDPHGANGGFPASHPGVLAVAADASDRIATRMSATSVLIAPGRDIPTTVPGARWDFVSGSSFAAAHVSGLVSLLTELRPALKPSQIREELIADSAHAQTQSAGAIDACAVLTRTTGSCSCLCASAHAAKANPSP